MHRCIMCGRIIEEVEWKNKDDDYDEYDDEDMPRKAPSFCQRCLAKIKNEAEDKHKPPKPM